MSSTHICIVINYEFWFARRHVFCKCFFVTRDVELCQKFLFHNWSLPSSTYRKQGFKRSDGVACFQHPELVMQDHVSSYQGFLLTLGHVSKVRSCGPERNICQLLQSLLNKIIIPRAGILKERLSIESVSSLSDFKLFSLYHFLLSSS